MGARTVAGADGRTWSVRRNIEWRPPATGDEFEHDVDGGRGAVLLILSALFLFWVVLIVWAPSQRARPVVPAGSSGIVIVVFFPMRWMLRRPWTLVAETAGGYDLPAEHWTGMVRGRSRAKEEMRVARPQPAHPRHPGARRQPAAPGQLRTRRA